MTGRPVDIEIMPKAHALLSASSAERWLVCTPSARIEEALEDENSSYAGDGTAAHAFAELRLRYLLKQITKSEYVAGYEATKSLYAEYVEEWTHADWDAIHEYVDYVIDEANRLDAEVHIEDRIDYSKYAEGGFGTSDALLVSRSLGVIKSIDLKFGKGVPVSAVENAQAKLYALGGLLKYDPKGEFNFVEWTIHQPRLNSVSSDSTSVTDLILWAENVVAPAAELAWEGKGKLVPTDKGCRFCKAAPTCRARIAENVLIARRDFAMDYPDKPDIRLDEYLMTPEEIAKILPNLDGWIQWANAVKAYALKMARDKGEGIEGYKLVRGRASRRWAVGDPRHLADELKKLGVSETDIFEEPAMRSVAQLEKQIGRKAFTDKVIPANLVSTPPGTPALVPVTDPRPAISAAAEAAADFAAE